MQNLIEFIIKYKYWFAFFILEAISLSILFRFNNYQGSVFFTTANSMVGGVYNTVDGVTSYVGLGAVNKRLESENEQLRAEVDEMKRELASRRIDTIKYTNFKASRYHFISAKVINVSTHRSNNLITLDKGEDDGIKQDMGVICSSGAVGIVYLTSSHYSIVMPLINVKSKVNCQLAKHHTNGTLEWSFGSSEYATMFDVPLHVKPYKNELIVTNGFSDIFPSGIPVGNVEDIERSSDGMSHKIKVRLAVDYTSVQNVSVISNYNHAEKTKIEEEADSILTAE